MYRLKTIVAKRSPALVTVPIIGLHRHREANGIRNSQLFAAFGLRKAKLQPSGQQMSPSTVFNEELMRSHVVIKVFFTKADPIEYDGPNHMLGSGFVVDKSGVILTTTTVVRNYGYVKVRFPYLNKEFKGRVADQGFTYGLALIQLLDDSTDWTPIQWNTQWNDRSVPPNGTQVYAITNSRFDYNNSVTKGMISGDQVKGDEVNDMVCNPIYQYWPHSATVGSGDMGCALVDNKGLVLGINVFQNNRNKNFVLISPRVQDYIDSLRSQFVTFKDEPKVASVGAIVHWITRDTRNTYGSAEDISDAIIPETGGVLVWGIDIDFEPEGGVSLGKYDIITHVSGQPVTDVLVGVPNNESTFNDGIISCSRRQIDEDLAQGTYQQFQHINNANKDVIQHCAPLTPTFIGGPLLKTFFLFAIFGRCLAQTDAPDNGLPVWIWAIITLVIFLTIIVIVFGCWWWWTTPLFSKGMASSGSTVSRSTSRSTGNTVTSLDDGTSLTQKNWMKSGAKDGNPSDVYN